MLKNDIKKNIQISYVDLPNLGWKALRKYKNGKKMTPFQNLVIFALFD